MPSYVDSPEYRYFVAKVKDLTGIDLGNYKPWQIQRRLAFIMGQAGSTDYREYADMLASDEAKLTAFVNWVTINVSEFYRDVAKFKELEEKILPALLEKSAKLKIWSAGCSNGAEPYTLALILESLTPGVEHKIIGTDLDSRILKVARDGRYLERDVRNVPKPLFQRFFTKDGEKFVISEDIRRRVEFRRHDLLRDPYEDGFDLILCRNVVIYFTNEAKDSIYRRFWASLKDEGVLFVGGSESILNARELGFKVTSPFFYVKISEVGGLDVKKAG
ncbi:MAG: protein-glutamate O-methyltransferase CheR [Firmicutes bacterium]|nr:protein-glutamate O-methyltransferase CheR [Bacillota bacterium]